MTIIIVYLLSQPVKKRVNILFFKIARLLYIIIQIELCVVNI